MNKNCLNNKNMIGLHATILIISNGSMTRRHNLALLTLQKRNFQLCYWKLALHSERKKYHVQMLK